jgi:endonuclease/exonuclease/phosphatase family metal-dependent hydrolase
MMKKVFLLSVLLTGLVVVVLGEGRVHHEHRHSADEESEETEETENESSEESESFVESSAKQQQDADLVQSLYKLVKQGTEQDRKLSAELSTEAAQSAALQTDLTLKQQQLVRHQNLMKNLQICLAHGPEALSQQQTPAPMSALETAAKDKTSAEGTCDCMKLKQKVADARMELENSSNGEQMYKKQYEKAAAMLTAAQKKLHRQRMSKKQPTQKTLCDKLTTCSACGAVDGCTWCGSSLGFGGVEKGTGMCRRLDVNARLRGHPKMDGLTSGECEAKSWQTKVTSRMSSLSFNVFASDLKNARRRARTVFALIKRTDPTFIAFQEVEDWFLQALKLESWVQNYYQSDFGSGHAPGGLYILSKYPLSKVAYNEQTAPGQVQYDQRARVLTVNAVINQSPASLPPAKRGAAPQPVVVPSAGAFVLTVATTTLDWRSSDARTDGLDFVFATLSPYNDVLLMGDFNFDHGALPETSHIPENWLDVWPALNPDNMGHTWNPDTNRYARASDPTSRPSRIDRVLVKSVHWLPRYIKLVGCSSADLLCAGSFSAPAVINRPHPLPQPLSQPHASTEANSPPLTALAKPSRAALGRGRSANSVFLEMATEVQHRIAAATTSWASLDTEAETESDEELARALVIPSNHYALLTHFSRFNSHC